jgi:hypothetical protein
MAVLLNKCPHGFGVVRTDMAQPIVSGGRPRTFLYVCDHLFVQGLDFCVLGLEARLDGDAHCGFGKIGIFSKSRGPISFFHHFSWQKFQSCLRVGIWKCPAKLEGRFFNELIEMMNLLPQEANVDELYYLKLQFGALPTGSTPMQLDNLGNEEFLVSSRYI